MPLTANKERFVRAVERQSKGSGVGADSSEFYEGQLVSFSATGRVTPSTDTVGHHIAGVCTKRVTTGASNTVKIEFEYGHQEWFPSTAITAADLGTMAVVSDDTTLTDAGTATNDVEAGVITELETKRGAAGAWIRVAEFAPDSA